MNCCNELLLSVSLITCPSCVLSSFVAILFSPITSSPACIPSSIRSCPSRISLPGCLSSGLSIFNLIITSPALSLATSSFATFVHSIRSSVVFLILFLC